MSRLLRSEVGEHIIEYNFTPSYVHVIINGRVSFSETTTILLNITEMKKDYSYKKPINLIIELDKIICNEEFFTSRQMLIEFFCSTIINKLAILKKMNHSSLMPFSQIVRLAFAKRIDGNKKLKYFIFLTEAKSWIMKVESSNDFRQFLH